MRLLLSLVLVSLSAVTASSQTVTPLWNGPAPQSHGTGPNDTPTITSFLPADATAPTSAILICPGGAYAMLAGAYEGANEAKYFQAHGVAAFVLKYRLPTKGYRHPVPMLDVQRALRLIRSHAADWKLDPAKIGVMGFSAGGHLASTLDTHFDAGDPQATDPVDQVSCRPDFAVLVYPVITLQESFTHEGTKTNLLGPNPDPALVKSLSNETQVTPQTPPTLLVHAADDDGVPIANSRSMHAALQKAGVASELHEYPEGGHGFGHGPNDYNTNEPAGWLDKAYAWIESQGFVS